jgi:hypothetical protein
MSEPTNDPNRSYRHRWVVRCSPSTASVARVRRLGCIAFGLSAGVLAAACGSDEPPSTADWADGVCSAINTWTGSLTSAADSLKDSGLSEDSLKSAADDVESATDQLESDLQDLGRPNTPAGQQAKDAVDQLSSQLKTDIDSIKSTVDGVSGVADVAAAAATVSDTAETMKTQVASTAASLEQLDASAQAELQAAFQQSTACQQLSSSSSS